MVTKSLMAPRVGENPVINGPEPMSVNGWLAELPLMKQHYESFGDRMPAGLSKELADLEKRLLAAK